MSEPQIPGTLRGMPREGNPWVPATTPGYTQGPLPNFAPTVPVGNPNRGSAVPLSRANRTTKEWGW
jgi:hypothetical protein